MVATDKLFAGSIPEIYDRFLVPLIFEIVLRSTWPSGWPRRIRGMYWRRPREPGSLRERSHRGFLNTRASSQPTSISQCSIMQRRGSLMMLGSSGDRLMPWRCRFRIKASMRWSASLA